MNTLIVVLVAGLAGGVGFFLNGMFTRPKEQVAAQVNEPPEAAKSEVDVVDILPIPLAIVDLDMRKTTKNRALVGLASGSTALLLDDAVDGALQKALNGVEVSETLTFGGPPPLICELHAGKLNGSGAYAVLIDVTEKSRADSMRTDFIANISHELKTPVGAVAVLAEALMGETDPATIERLTGRMLTESERAAKTIDDLLELSQTEQSISENTEDINVEELLLAVKARYDEASRQRRIKIVVEASPSAHVTGDRQQIASALGNLVDNAVKYSLDEGVVILRSVAGAEDTTIEVCDSGVGIPSSDLDRIFERFYRVDKARSRGTGGTGLGLAIVRHVVTNHGGTVQVTSTEGEGSCFRLLFPMKAEA
ncbi:MAG: sensor histidine kinase [Ilumatobacteraceae bacterium]